MSAELHVLHPGSQKSSGSEFQTVGLQQRRAPDGRLCGDGGVARRLWWLLQPNADTVGKRRQRLVSSGPSGYWGARSWSCWRRYTSACTHLVW